MSESEDEIIFYIKKYRELDEKKERRLEMLVLTKLIELDPRCEVPYNNFYFNHYYNRGVLYGYLDKSEKAIADYTKAIEINPSHYLAWGNRGVCYSDLGDHDAAVADLEQSLKINPESFFNVTLDAVKNKFKAS